MTMQSETMVPITNNTKRTLERFTDWFFNALSFPEL